MARFSLQERDQHSEKEDRVFRLLDQLERIIDRLVERLELCKDHRRKEVAE